MTDIVKRLRGQERAPCDATDEEALDCREGACNCDWKTRQEAAAEIERLRDALRYMGEGFWQIVRAALGEGKE